MGYNHHAELFQWGCYSALTHSDDNPPSVSTPGFLMLFIGETLCLSFDKTLLITSIHIIAIKVICCEPFSCLIRPCNPTVHGDQRMGGVV